MVKVGTGVVSRPDGRLALGRIGALVEELCERVDAGDEMILVSSGAIGLGAGSLGMRKPTAPADRQAAAAVGQGSLIALYDGMFRRQGRVCAQVLLTESDFHHRSHYLNLAAALERLLELRVVPVINENDVVSTAELALTGKVFGDNDRLGALVASNLGADLLVLLSDVDGLYTAPPGTPGAEPIRTFTAQADYAIGAGSALGRGGMASKVAAARIAARSGVEVVIADGTASRPLTRVLAGGVGTTFPAEPGMNRRKTWIAFATAPAGRLTVNAGAREALVARNASLLVPGITAIDGEFEAGAVVELACGDEVFGRGRALRGASVLRAALTAGERGTAVHRDDTALLGS